MPIVVKRKLPETWREAVARRGEELGLGADCLRAFDEELENGAHEAEAAYRALQRFDCLYVVPDGPVPGRKEEPSAT
jgi:hypothetical protein